MEQYEASPKYILCRKQPQIRLLLQRNTHGKNMREKVVWLVEMRTRQQEKECSTIEEQ